MEYVIRKDLIDFTKKAGFIITKEDDYDNMEVRDSKNNNELLRRFNHHFEGSNGRSVLLQLNYAVIKFNEKITLSKEGLDKLFLKYTLKFDLDNHKNYEINFYCNFMDDKNLGRVSVELISYGKTREQKELTIFLKSSGIDIYNENNLCSFIDAKNSNSEICLKTIIEFFNSDEFIPQDSQIQECLKIIFLFLQKDIESILHTKRIRKIK